MVRVTDSNMAIIILGIIYSGVVKKTNIYTMVGANYSRVKKIIGKLVDLGYIAYVGNDIVLTERGQKFCVFFTGYRDLYGEVLYSRPWLHLFES